MSDAFYEATGGAYRIEISPNELLGSQKDAFELVQSGTIQMAMVANSIVEKCKSWILPCWAFLTPMSSVEHQKRYLPAEPWTISLQVQKPTISALWRHLQQERAAFATDKPIQTPADLKGYKIRVMESQTCIAMLDAMGGVGTPMAQERFIPRFSRV